MSDGSEISVKTRTDQAGAVYYRAHRKFGKKHGTEEYLNSTTGEPTIRRHWVDGKQHGPEEWWMGTGSNRKRWRSMHWVNGEKHGVEEYICCGLVHIIRWVNGKKHGAEEWWSDAGALIDITHWVSGVKCN